MRTLIGVAALLVLLLGAQPALANTTHDQANVDDTEHATTGGDTLLRTSMPATVAGDTPATGRIYLAKADAPKAAMPPVPDAKAESSAIDQLRADYKSLKKAFAAYKNKDDGGDSTLEVVALITAFCGALFTIGKTVHRYRSKASK